MSLHGCCNKMPQTGWFDQQTFISRDRVLEARKSKIKVQLIQFLTRDLFLACRWLPSCCVLTQWRERQRYRQKHRRKQRRGEIERTLILLIRALIPPWQPHPYALIYSWLSNKGPTSKYHHPLGLGFNVQMSGRGWVTNIPSIGRTSWMLGAARGSALKLPR